LWRFCRLFNYYPIRTRPNMHLHVDLSLGCCFLSFQP
jgi:hypothetical protein